MCGKSTNLCLPAVFAAAAFLSIPSVIAAPVLPGYVTDPTAVKDALEKDESYQPPERLKYPYISTYYVKPTVKAGDVVKVGFFVTDFESSLIRFLDDSHRFTAHLEYRPRGGASTILTLDDLKSGDAEFDLGSLPVGEYEMRVWAVDAKGRESHRVIHDFRVVEPAFLEIPADKVYAMTVADLATYGIRNDGDFERIVLVGSNTTEVVKEKRAGVPGYTVTVPLDPKTGKVPATAFKKAKVAYDEGYDKAAVERMSVTNAVGLQKLLDDKAAAGFRKVVLLPGTYRLSYTKSLFIPGGMTLDLGTATLKQNAFTGASSVMVRMAGVADAHLVGGTLEGDYWTHDYARSPNNSEWPAGFEIGGASWYCSVEGVKVADITGYGGQNGISKDAPGGLFYFVEGLPHFTPGGLDPKTGDVDAMEEYRFTTDFKDLQKVRAAGRGRLQISKLLGYQGVATRSWQMTVAWYDAEKRFISAETAWQYREMWIPADAAYLRVSVEEESAKAADEAGLTVTAMRHPVNCAVKNCRFERCRCVGYAASAMKNMLFEGDFFTQSGESAACCAFDAEDGWDQIYFLKNVFRDNPRNNSILTCAGHNFVFEENDGDIYLWGRTHSPCARGNAIGDATYRCDSRLRSGYGRFEGNTYKKGVHLGLNDAKARPDNWDYVLSGLTFDGGDESYAIDVGTAGRVVNCTFRNMPVRIANAYACTFENCTDGSTYLPFPGGRWLEVTVKGSKFSRFYQSNSWERCHFTDTKLERFFGGSMDAKNCDFAGCSLFGLDSSAIRMTDCAFDGTTVQGNYWEKPADLQFRNCAIKTRGDAPFLKLGVYTIGRIGFGSCVVSGNGSLVDVGDLRPIRLPANADPATNPDNRSGAITVRDCTFGPGVAKAISISGYRSGASPKKVTVEASGNTFSEPSDTIIADAPATWNVAP